jgi:hypothetical protein
MMVVPNVLDGLQPLHSCPAQLALPRPRILPRACSDTTEYFWHDPACIGHRGDQSSALTRPRRSRRTLCIEPQLNHLTVRS